MKTRLVLMLLVTSMSMAGCAFRPPPQQPAAGPAGQVAPEPTQPAQAAAPEGSGLSTAALKDATYSGIFDQPITLSDGLYEGEPFAAGDAARPVVEYIDGTEMFGDLDGDGVDDAVVFLVERSGGSGAFTYVAAQLNRDGQPADAGAVRIEDRIGVKAAAVRDGQIALEIITQGPGDAACCSSHKANKTYALREGKLAETTPQGGDLVRVSAADLDGTAWRLLELGEGQPAAAGAEVTLRFADGEVTGSGGCNTYAGGFTLGEDNPFVTAVGAVTSTQQTCPDPITTQEGSYLSALQGVSRWGYDFGKLALYYADGANRENRLLFAPLDAQDGPMAIPAAVGEAPFCANSELPFQRSEPDYNAKQLDETGDETMKDATQPQSTTAKPAAVTALEAAYGAPSQAGFGSAVFHESLKPDDSLEEAALARYKYFTGELWERWGQAAWMGPWKEVYARKAGAKPDVVAELRGIKDLDAALSVPMILDNIQGAEKARAALAAVFDDPAVTELRVYNLGDGGAMSGLLVAGRSASEQNATFLVFLLD